MSCIKVIAIPDIQAPRHDPVAVDTAIRIVKGEKPDVVIYIGDVADLKSVSKYKDKSWEEAAITADVEIKAANEILDRFDKVIPPKANKVFLEGNHDRRLSLWFIQNAAKLGPNYYGNDIPSQLHLADRECQYVPTERQPYRIGKLGFVHGWYANKYHANKTVQMAGQNLLYGHTHDYQVYTGPHLEKEAPRIAMSMGCLCDFRQPYLDSRANNWIHGVGIIYIDVESGRFWPYFCPIINGESVINGKVYRAAS